MSPGNPGNDRPYLLRERCSECGVSYHHQHDCERRKRRRAVHNARRSPDRMQHLKAERERFIREAREHGTPEQKRVADQIEAMPLEQIDKDILDKVELEILPPGVGVPGIGEIRPGKTGVQVIIPVKENMEIKVKLPYNIRNGTFEVEVFWEF